MRYVNYSISSTLFYNMYNDLIWTLIYHRYRRRNKVRHFYMIHIAIFERDLKKSEENNVKRKNE